MQNPTIYVSTKSTGRKKVLSKRLILIICTLPSKIKTEKAFGSQIKMPASVMTVRRMIKMLCISKNLKSRLCLHLISGNKKACIFFLQRNTWSSKRVAKKLQAKDWFQNFVRFSSIFAWSSKWEGRIFQIHLGGGFLMAWVTFTQKIRLNFLFYMDKQKKRHTYIRMFDSHLLSLSEMLTNLKKISNITLKLDWPASSPYPYIINKVMTRK